MQTVTLGPFLLSAAVIALCVGVIAAQASAGFMARRGYGKVDAPLWWLLLWALVVARLAFVVRMWPSYAAHPLAIVDVRDGGFALLAGLLALVSGVVVVALARKDWRLALPASVLVGVAVWGLVLGAAVKLEQAAHPPLPRVVFENVDGESVALHAFTGQPLVINLWASWCGPCRREMPVLAEAQARHGDIHFVFADQGESVAQVRAYLNNNKLALDNVLLDTHSELSRHYTAPGYPTTLFIDARGQLLTRHVGSLSRATLQRQLQRLLAPTPKNGESP